MRALETFVQDCSQLGVDLLFFIDKVDLLCKLFPCHVGHTLFVVTHHIQHAAVV